MADVPAPAGPSRVIFTPTYRCNLRCETCYLFGRDGLGLVRVKELGLARRRELLAQLAPLRPSLLVVGGETLLDRGSTELLAAAAELGLEVTVCTNGTTLDYHARDVVAAGVHEVRVSLDGPRDVHDLVRGRGIFNSVERGVQTLLEARGGAAPPRVVLAPLVSQFSYERLGELADLAVAWGVDGLFVQHLMFTSRKRAAAHHEAFQALTGSPSRMMTGYEDLFSGTIDLERLKSELRALAGREDIEVRFSPDVPDLDAYYGDLERPFEVERCRFPWRGFRVLPDGGVSPCFGHPDYSVGNLLTDGLEAVWNGPAMQRFRDRLANGLLPGCARCCERDYAHPPERPAAAGRS